MTRTAEPGRVRLARTADAARCAEIYAPYVRGTAITFETEPPSTAEFRKRILQILRWTPWLVYERGGLILGYAYASRHRERAAYRWSLDVAVYIDKRHHRQGIGRALYSKLFDCLKFQGFYSAYAGIALPNSSSVGLHEALGFRPVGVYRRVGYKLGAWHDVGWWGLALAEQAGHPKEPTSLPQALGRLKQEIWWT